MVREVATSPSRVVCVVGLAGAGKTTATHAVAQVFAQAGIAVLGAAPSGVAAEKLQDETGIPSTTLHRLLDDARAGGGLPPGSRARRRRGRHGRDARPRAACSSSSSRPSGKAILIGDPHQLPAVGAGGLFAGIVEREGAVVLTENRRQRDELERDALARVRAGVGRDYLAYAEKRERLVVSESPVDDARAPARRLVGARPRRPRRQRHARAPPPRRRRPQPARPLAHGRRRPARQASASPSRTASSPPATASSASATPTASASRTAPAEPSSGSTATGGRSTVATDRGPTVELSRRYLEAGNVRHAYALTGHAAQGLTVERAFVLGAGEARLQEWGYVALSRARAETRLYVTGTPREHESHFHDLDDRDPLARFGRALEESAVEELAVDQHPLPSGPRHDARPEIERSELSADERTRRRLLEQKRRALAKTRETAERKLATAEEACSVRRPSPPSPQRATPRSRPSAPSCRSAHEQLAETSAQIEASRFGVGRPGRSAEEESRDRLPERGRGQERGLVLER